MKNMLVFHDIHLADHVSLTYHSILRKLYTEPSIGTYYQISINLAKWFQRRIFKLANHKQELPMAAMEILYRLSSFRGKDFFEIDQPDRNKNCLWQPCLLTDRDEMSNLYRESSRDASYKVSVHLAKQFKRTQRIFFQKLTNQKQELPMVAMFVNRQEWVKKVFFSIFMILVTSLIKYTFCILTIYKRIKNEKFQSGEISYQL